MNLMQFAPKDGTRILLCYKPAFYINGRWIYRGSKWEECRWIKGLCGGPSHWESWCGVDQTRSTHTIDSKYCLGWLPLPSQ